jgi:predicted acyl esterase
VAGLALVALAGLVGCSDSSFTGPATSYPGGIWSPPEPTFGTLLETGVEIQVSDGVVLVGDVNYPADLETGARADGAFPVILTQNPYGTALGGTLAASAGSFFVTRGYIFAGVDVRGTSRSGGGPQEFIFSPRAAQDGAELVEWASALDGSNGDVGLWGCSFLGINQLETAILLGPDSPVKAMIPACLSGDAYRDTLYDNGIPGPTATVWPGTWPDAQAGGDFGFYRDYWRAEDRVAHAPEIFATGIPALLWAGWREGGSLGALELYAALQNLHAGRPATARMSAGQRTTGKYQVILGDWTHGGGLDRGIELQWYETWIKGVDTGLPTGTRTPLHLQELGSGRWVNADTYPIVDAYTQLFLTPSGLLSESPDEAGEDALTWVPPDEVSSSLDYVSAPFADGAMLAGPIVVELEVSSSNTNAQLLTELFDLAPDGATTVITHASVLGSRRALDAEKSWIDRNELSIRPYLALDADDPLVPGTRTRLDVPLPPMLWSIEPGHRLRLRVSTRPRAEECVFEIGRPPWGCHLTEPMLETLPGGVYTIHYGGTSGSALRLPLLPHGDLPTARSVMPPTAGGETTLPGDW